MRKTAFAAMQATLGTFINRPSMFTFCWETRFEQQNFMIVEYKGIIEKQLFPDSQFVWQEV
jgi:hypothetical protein